MNKDLDVCNRVGATAPLQIVVLAAGKGTRFGKYPKLLSIINGRTVLDWSLEGALFLQSCGQKLGLKVGVCVVTGSNANQMQDFLSHWQMQKKIKLAPVQDFSVVFNPHFEQGISTSLVAVAKVFSGVNMAILLGDEPFVPQSHLKSLLTVASEEFLLSREGGSDIVVSRHEGRAGVPLLLSAAFLPQLDGLSGDIGVSALLNFLPTGLVSYVDLLENLRDIDTIEDHQELVNLQRMQGVTKLAHI